MSAGTIATGLANEVTERLFRETINRALANAQSRGEDPRAAVRSALENLTGNRNFERAARRIVGAIPGATYGPHILAAGLGRWIASRNLSQHILPDDNSVFAQTARTMFQMLPAATVGVGDSFSDILRGWVDNVQNSPTVAQADRTGVMDRVFRTRLVPGRVFIALLDDNGEIRRYDDNVPMCRDASGSTNEWANAHDMWVAANAARRETRGNARNRQTVIVPGQPFPYENVPPERVVEIMQAGGATPGDIEEVRRLFGPKRSWAQRLSDDSVLCIQAYSRASRRFGGLEDIVAEDLSKDLPDKVSPDDINRLFGGPFAPLVIDRDQNRPTFEREDYLDAKSVLDKWLKAELQASNKILLLASSIIEAARNRGFNPVAMFLVTILVASPFVAAAALYLFGFLQFILMFIDGFSTQPDAVAQLGGETVSGVKYAAYTMIKGYVMIWALTWVLPIWQKLLDAIPGLKGEVDWMKSLGRKISAFAIVFGGMSVVSALLGIDVIWRLLLVVGVLTPIATAMGLVDIGYNHRARQKYANSIVYIEYAIGVVPIVMVYLCGTLSAHTGEFVTGLTLVGMAWAFIAKMVVASKWLSTVAVAVMGLVFALLVHRLSVRPVKIGARFYNVRSKVRWAGACIGLILVAMMGYVWFADPAEKLVLTDIVDPKVSVTDITTVDPTTGSRMREKEITYASGDTFEKRKGTVVQASAPAPKPKGRDLCSDPSMPARDRAILCK